MNDAGRAGPGRRGSRERVLGLLYEADMSGVDPVEVLDAQTVAPDRYAREAVRGFAQAAPDVDAIIEDASHGWHLERMPRVDRALLRLATWELAHRPDVPTGVILSEAVELAKEYSTEDSGRFVNGVLAEIARRTRPDAPAEDPTSA